MKTFYAALLLAVACPSLAHGPTPQKTDQSVLLDTPPGVLWKLLSEPCEISRWHPEVAECVSPDSRKRTLTLKNGAKLNEEIDEILPEEMSISYRLAGDVDPLALPVSSLTGRIRIKMDGQNTQVTWLARYYRADTTNEPPKDKNDESALTAVNAYINSGLDGLNKFTSKNNTHQ